MGVVEVVEEEGLAPKGSLASQSRDVDAPSDVLEEVGTFEPGTDLTSEATIGSAVLLPYHGPAVDATGPLSSAARGPAVNGQEEEH